MRRRWLGSPFHPTSRSFCVKYLSIFFIGLPILPLGEMPDTSRELIRPRLWLANASTKLAVEPRRPGRQPALQVRDFFRVARGRWIGIAEHDRTENGPARNAFKPRSSSRPETAFASCSRWRSRQGVRRRTSHTDATAPWYTPKLAMGTAPRAATRRTTPATRPIPTGHPAPMTSSATAQTLARAAPAAPQ